VSVEAERWKLKAQSIGARNSKLHEMKKFGYEDLEACPVECRL
jgi:hypothetical protein